VQWAAGGPWAEIAFRPVVLGVMLWFQRPIDPPPVLGRALTARTQRRAQLVAFFGRGQHLFPAGDTAVDRRKIAPVEVIATVLAADDASAVPLTPLPDSGRLAAEPYSGVLRADRFGGS
jgi:hypothetical protein